jgi:hypothetical protein
MPKLPMYYGSIICHMVTETRTLEANLLKFDKTFLSFHFWFFL